MRKIGCYDIALMVIDEASEQVSPDWRVDEERLKTFGRCCDAIDKLSRDIGAKS